MQIEFGQTAVAPGKRGRQAAAAQRISGLGVVMIVAGGLATSGAAIAALAWVGNEPGGAAAVLTNVPAQELEAAASSLYPSVAVATIADARSCRAPLAMVQVWKAASTTAGDTIRIRSGSYVSPPFKVGPAAERIAIPYPAPYAAGKGAIVVLGEGRDYAIALSPVRRLADLAGAQEVPVVWQPKSPC